jgi:hypothetical protein
MCDQKKLLNKKILVVAALLSSIASTAYACPGLGHSLDYSLCRQISLAGLPGILIAAAVSMALLGGSHGGGPLGMLLIIATPLNFLLYVGVGVAARAAWKTVKTTNDSST